MEPAFYYHRCLKCDGIPDHLCLTCAGSGKIKSGLMRSETCPKCKGKKTLRCDACAGMRRFKVFRLPAIMDGVKMEHSEQYYDAVCERLSPLVNMIIDSVDYHAIRALPNSHDSLSIDGPSVITLKPTGLAMEGFVSEIPTTPAQWVKSKLNVLVTNPAMYTRFIGKLMEIKKLQPPALGCHYMLQMYFLDFVDPGKQRQDTAA